MDSNLEARIPEEDFPSRAAGSRFMRAATLWLALGVLLAPLLAGSVLSTVRSTVSSDAWGTATNGVLTRSLATLVPASLLAIAHLAWGLLLCAKNAHVIRSLLGIYGLDLKRLGSRNARRKALVAAALSLPGMVALCTGQLACGWVLVRVLIDSEALRIPPAAILASAIGAAVGVPWLLCEMAIALGLVASLSMAHTRST
jgi:hypothetical protein